jgi:hypothetical protein
VKICNSFLSISALAGPTPLRYSTGVSRKDSIIIHPLIQSKIIDFSGKTIKKPSLKGRVSFI